MISSTTANGWKMCGIPIKPVLVYLQTEMDMVISNRWDPWISVPFICLCLLDILLRKIIIFSDFLPPGWYALKFVTGLQLLFKNFSTYPTLVIWSGVAVPKYFYFIQVLHSIEAPYRRHSEERQRSCWCSCAVALQPQSHTGVCHGSPHSIPQKAFSNKPRFWVKPCE